MRSTSTLSLSTRPRAPRVVPSFTVTPRRKPSFVALGTARVVGLRSNGTYDLARDVCANQEHLIVRSDPDNQFSPVAVAVYASETNELIGYLEDGAVVDGRTVRDRLDQGAIVRGDPVGRVEPNKPVRGGSFQIEISVQE